MRRGGRLSRGGQPMRCGAGLARGEAVVVESRACPTLPEIIGALSGVAPPSQVAELVQHLLGCPACRDTLARLNISNSLVQWLQAARESGVVADRERIDDL